MKKLAFIMALCTLESVIQARMFHNFTGEPLKITAVKVYDTPDSDQVREENQDYTIAQGGYQEIMLDSADFDLPDDVAVQVALPTFHVTQLHFAGDNAGSKIEVVIPVSRLPKDERDSSKIARNIYIFKTIRDEILLYNTRNPRNVPK